MIVTCHRLIPRPDCSGVLAHADVCKYWTIKEHSSVRRDYPRRSPIGRRAAGLVPAVFVLSLPVEDLAGTLGLSAGVDPAGDGDIFDSDAQRFEQRNILRMLATRITANNDLPQLAHVGLAQRAVFQRLLKIASFQTSLVLAVHGDDGAATHRHAV